MKKILLILMLLSVPCLGATRFPDNYLDLSPELSWGVLDNGPAWVELVPFRGFIKLDNKTKVSMGMSYAFEIDRDKKPLSGANHYGWRIGAKVENKIADNINAFIEINLGHKTEGAINNIGYLQTYNYQRIGIKWDIQKFMFDNN